jgi:hypothetical protein
MHKEWHDAHDEWKAASKYFIQNITGLSFTEYQ